MLRRRAPVIFVFALTVVFALCRNIALAADRRSPDGATTFLGFDRNDYPGDGNLRELRTTFSYAGYWLNDPPGSKTNTWAGNRQKLQAAGFGFLVLFNGRLYKELTTDAAGTGKRDAEAAIAAARHEGFPPRTIIFLDQEQGGRLLPEQAAYLFAWIDEIAKAGYRAGVYCSGMAAHEKGGASVVTAEVIRRTAGDRDITFWVTNDACPPSPGCTTAAAPPPRASGIDFADVWQFAQSPQRKDVARACRGYHSSGSCYSSSEFARQNLHVDLDAATSSDPSHGRSFRH